MAEIIDLGELVPAEVESFDSWEEMQRLVHEKQSITGTRNERQALPLRRLLYFGEPARKHVPQSILGKQTLLNSTISRQKHSYRSVHLVHFYLTVEL